jgi:hypothetical protein
MKKICLLVLSLLMTCVQAENNCSSIKEETLIAFGNGILTTQE